MPAFTRPEHIFARPGKCGLSAYRLDFEGECFRQHTTRLLEGVGHEVEIMWIGFQILDFPAEPHDLGQQKPIPTLQIPVLANMYPADACTQRRGHQRQQIAAETRIYPRPEQGRPPVGACCLKLPEFGPTRGEKAALGVMTFLPALRICKISS